MRTHSFGLPRCLTNTLPGMLASSSLPIGPSRSLFFSAEISCTSVFSPPCKQCLVAALQLALAQFPAYLPPFPPQFLWSSCPLNPPTVLIRFFFETTHDHSGISSAAHQKPDVFFSPMKSERISVACKPPCFFFFVPFTPLHLLSSRTALPISLV